MKNYIDSSDEEKVGSYQETNLFTELKNYYHSSDIDNFKIYLSLMLSYLADRFFKQSSVNDTYQEMKCKYLQISAENLEQFKQDMINFSSCLQNPIELKGKEIPAFNSLFSPYNNTLTKQVKLDIKKQISQDPKFKSFDSLCKYLPTFSSLEIKDASALLALSKIINRANKNILKVLTLQDIQNHTVSNNYTFGNTILKQFTTGYDLSSKNFNISSEIKGMGSYSDIFHRINMLNSNDSRQFIDLIKAIIQNKESNCDLKSTDKVFAEQLTNLLFVTEMQREVSTVFMAPMMLELTLQGASVKENQIEAMSHPENIFPMAYPTAVARIRNVIKVYHSILPNTHIMDYDQDPNNNGSGQKYRDFLLSKANLLIKWLVSKLAPDDHSLDFLKLERLEKIKISKKYQNLPVADHGVLTLCEIAEYLKINNLGFNDNDLPSLKQKLCKNENRNLRLKTNTKFQESSKDLELKRQVQELFNEFDKHHVTYDKYFKKIDSELEQFKAEEFESALKLILTELTVLIKDYYNIDFKFTSFLKAGGEKKEVLDPNQGEQNAVIDKIVQVLKENKIIKDQESISKVLDGAGMLAASEQNIEHPGKRNRNSLEKDVSDEEDISEGSSKRQKVEQNIEQQISGTGVYIQKNIKVAIKQVATILTHSNMSKNNFGEIFEEAGKQYVDLMGSGEFGEEKSIDYINSYFGKYTIDALGHILNLRVSDLQINNIKALKAFFIDQEHNDISELLNKVMDATTPKSLVLMNLFNKHAVGLVFEKDQSDSIVSIKYLDSLNKEIPQELKQLIISRLDSQIRVNQITVEQQKYANCGPEVIENFTQYLTGRRVTQEKAIELHSKLVENALLGIKSLGMHLLFEDLSDHYINAEDYLEQDKYLDSAYNSVIHNFDYVKSQQIELIGQDHLDTM